MQERLASFTKHVFKTPHCNMYQHFIPLSCQIIFHCMDIGPFVYSCLCWWTFRLCGSWCAVQTFCCSVTKSCPTLLPCGLYHARLPCPSASPRVGSNSCSLSWWCHPTISSCLTLLLLTSIFPSISVFSNESALCFRWPKYWSFSFSISPSIKYSGLISFRIDWFDLAVQKTLRSLLQHHNSKAETLLC